jgi:hypothetical protein
MSVAALTAQLLAAVDLAAFLHRHGRLPRLGDTTAPWHYGGWLIPYVVELHALIPAVADRWGYHLRTLEAGRLLDEPIPQVTFGVADPKVFGLLHDWSRVVGYDCGGWSDFRRLLDWLCWALALSQEEPRLSDGVNEALYRRVDVTPLLQAPHDYLGEYVAQGKARGCAPSRRTDRRRSAYAGRGRLVRRRLAACGPCTPRPCAAWGRSRWGR